MPTITSSKFCNIKSFSDFPRWSVTISRTLPRGMRTNKTCDLVGKRKHVAKYFSMLHIYVRKCIQSHEFKMLLCGYFRDKYYPLLDHNIYYTLHLLSYFTSTEFNIPQCLWWWTLEMNISTTSKFQIKISRKFHKPGKIGDHSYINKSASHLNIFQFLIEQYCFTS